MDQIKSDRLDQDATEDSNQPDSPGVGTTSFGLNGDDILHGSASNDELYGGQGDDRYLFDADGFGHDIIHDKDGGKLIIDGDLFAGMASSQGENQYKLNGMDLTVESMDGIQNLKLPPLVMTV